MKSFSSTFYHKEGPDLLIRYYTSEDLIFRIDLSLNTETGLAWQLYGDYDARSVETKIHQWMEKYVQRINPQIELPLFTKGLSPFTLKVLQGLSSIPFGQVLSYKQLASLVGSPAAYRAVGNACGSNPFPFILPCHRIVTSKNTLGGFSAGLEIKKRLLEFETQLAP